MADLTTWDESKKYLGKCLEDMEKNIDELGDKIKELTNQVTALVVEVNVIKTKLLFFIGVITLVSSAISSIVVSLIINWLK